jgi:hypothetical protein
MPQTLDRRLDKILDFKGSDDGVYHSGLMGFWTLFIIGYSKEHNFSDTGSVSVLR